MADNGRGPRAGDAVAPAADLKPKRARATIDLSVGLEAKLDELALKRGETRTDVLRRALEFYVKCEELREKDFEVGAFATDSDGSKKTYIFA